MGKIIQRVFCAALYDNDDKKAIQARNKWLKEAKQEGFNTSRSSLRNQLMTKTYSNGMEGDSHLTNCYIGNIWKRQSGKES